MSTAQSLIDDVRSRIVEPTASYFTDAELLRWLNQGYKRFITMTEWAEKVKAYSMVTNQFEYSLPSDIIKVVDIRWMDKYKVHFRDLEEWNRYVGITASNSGTRPYVYRLFPWDGKVRVYPKPSAASVSTTVSDNPLSSSNATINVADATAFPTYGRIVIESEQVLYTSTTATSFTGCVRGDGATIPATHANAIAVTAAPLEVYMTYMPADLATGGSAVGTAISATYDEALINYACHVAMLKRERYTESQLFRKLFDDIAHTAVEERRKMQMDRQFVIKDEDDYGTYYNWL